MSTTIPSLGPVASSADSLFLSTVLTLLTGHTLAKYYGLDLFKNAGVTAAAALLWGLFVFSITYSDSLPSRVLGDGMWATIDKIGDNGKNNGSPKPFAIGTTSHTVAVFYPFVASSFSMAALAMSILLTATTKMNFLTAVFFNSVWLVASYMPLTHWMKNFASVGKVSGWMGQSGFGVLDSSNTHSIHMNAGIAFLVLSFWMGELRTKTTIIPDYDNLFWLKLGFMGYIVGGVIPFSLAGTLPPNPIFAAPTFSENAPKLINTILASSAGFLTMVFIDVVFNHMQGLFKGKPSAINATTGALAGLIAISCGAGHVSPMWATFFGFYAAFSVYLAPFLLGFVGIDQGYSPFVLHFVAGAVGSALTGLFANNTYSGSASTTYNGSFYSNGVQLGRQCAGISVVALVSIVATTATYWFVYSVERLCFFPLIVSLKEGEEGEENLVKM